MRWKRTLEKRRAFTGWMFVLPWIVGVIPFFIIPLISTLYYSLGELKLAAGGIDVTFLGGGELSGAVHQGSDLCQGAGRKLENHADRILHDPGVWAVFALLLNQKFHGRTVARAILSCRLSSPPGW